MVQQGYTRDNLAQARSFFDRALTADPGNVDALIGSARADVVDGANFFVTDPMAAFAAAEAKLAKALSSVPDHARAHLYLGIVDITTKRAAEGIAECEHALALDRNLAPAHSSIGFGKVFIGRAEETEAHIAEALRLSPRDTMAYAWMTQAGIAKNHLGLWEQAVAWFRRAIEANRNYPHPYFVLGGRPRAARSDLTRRVRRSRPVSRSTRPSLSPAFAPIWPRGATTRRIWPSLSPFSKACARRGCRRNEAKLKTACGSGCDARRLPTGRTIRAWSILSRGEREQCAPTRFPNAASPRRARNHSLLADAAGRVSSSTPAAPRRPQLRA